MARIKKDEKAIKLEHGSVYRKKDGNGTYYYRYQINNDRKTVSLKTTDLKQAIKQAKQKHLPIVQSNSVDVIAAHVKHVRGLDTILKKLPLFKAWEQYSKSPDRATPATVSEQGAYKSTFENFVRFINDQKKCINDITPEIAVEYADDMRTKEIAVDTHNRKIRRLKKIFEVLKEYRDIENPFIVQSLFRKNREEHDTGIRRMSFTKDEESKLLKVLDDPKYKVMNKSEIRVVYYIGMFTGQRFKDCILLRWEEWA